MRLTHLCLFAVILTSCPPTSPPTPTQPEASGSDWGPPVAGLQARIHIPAEVEQNADLPVTLDLKYDPASLSHGVICLNFYNFYSRLRLISLSTGKEYDIDPFDDGGPPGIDIGDYLLSLDGRPIPPIPTTWLPRTAAPNMPPGYYNC